jgi:excisionase family DNA binding protein
MSAHLTRPPIEPLRVYSREEAAEVLNISLSTVKRLINAGHIRISQPEGMRRVFIMGQALLEFIEATEVKDPEKRAQLFADEKE